MTCSDGLEAGSKIACCLTIRFLESFVLSLSSLKSMLGRLVAIVAVSLGAAGSANATFVVGDWDPAYGSPFTNLGWRGTTTTSVTASCLALGPVGFVANSLACPMSLVSATVEFYAVNDLSPVPATVQTLNFTGLMSVSGIQLDAVTGNLDGVILSLSTPVAGTTALSLVGAQQASFRLEQVYSVADDRTYARLYWSVLNECEQEVGGVNGPKAEVKFSLRTVPEPGSLLLSGAALALVGLMRRRRNGR